MISFFLSILALVLIVASSHIENDTIWQQKLTSSEIRVSTACLKAGLIMFSVSMGLLSLYHFRNKRKETHNQKVDHMS